MDKVIKDLGLVVTLYEIVSIEGGTVYPGEGSAHFHVVFRVVVFRPFEGEVIEGRLKKADRKGLYVSIGFSRIIRAGAPAAGALGVRRERAALGVDVPERAQDVHGAGRADSVPRQRRSISRTAPIGGRARARVPRVHAGGDVLAMVVVGDINADGLGLPVVVETVRPERRDRCSNMCDIDIVFHERARPMTSAHYSPRDSSSFFLAAASCCALTTSIALASISFFVPFPSGAIACISRSSARCVPSFPSFT